MDYRLLIITAKSCGWCEKFKNDHTNGLEPLKKRLVELNIRYDYIETVLNDPIKIKSDLNSYDSRVFSYLKWFPTFILLEESSFNEKDSFLDAHVYGTTRKNKKEHFYVVERKNKVSNAQSDIIKWILTFYSQNLPVPTPKTEVILTRNGKKFSGIFNKIKQVSLKLNVNFVSTEDSSDEEYFTI